MRLGRKQPVQSISGNRENPCKAREIGTVAFSLGARVGMLCPGGEGVWLSCSDSNERLFCPGADCFGATFGCSGETDVGEKSLGCSPGIRGLALNPQLMGNWEEVGWAAGPAWWLSASPSAVPGQAPPGFFFPGRTDLLTPRSKGRENRSFLESHLVIWSSSVFGSKEED